MKTLSTREAAALLGCCTSKLLALVKNGDIPAAKFGRGFRFLEDELIGVLRNHSGAKEKAAGKKEKDICHSQNVVSIGTAALLGQTASRLEEALKQRTNRRPERP